MAELVVAEYAINSGRGKVIPPLFRCQENIAKWAKKSSQYAKLTRFRGQTAENSAKRARFSRQPVIAKPALLVKKTLLPAARYSLFAISYLLNCIGTGLG